MFEQKEVIKLNSAGKKDAEAADVAKNEYRIPELTLTGNRYIEILNHNLIYREEKDESIGKGVCFKLKNISDVNIGEIVFEVTFYDIKGDIIDKVCHIMHDFERGRTRILQVEPSERKGSDIKSYDIKITNMIATPVPVVTGNNQITILKHSLRETDNDDPRIMLMSFIDISIRNVSDKTIASAVFDAVFYDSVGNILDTVRHREYELKPDYSRMMIITTNKVKSGNAKSYRVTLIKTTTTDTEKVQICRHDIKTVENKEEIRGTLKNLTDAPTDAVLVATFKDSRDEKIGVKAIIVKNIQPGHIKSFRFSFAPPEGETVKIYSLDVAELVQEEINKLPAKSTV
jgi:hypothetical protein